MSKNDDFLDDLYKMMDPLGLDDLDGDGHYDSDERFLVDEDERDIQEGWENSHKRTTDFDDLDADDFDDDSDDFDADEYGDGDDED